MGANGRTVIGRRSGAARAEADDGPVEIASVGTLPYGVAIAVGTLGMLFASCA